MYITTFARGLSHCTSIIDPAFENLVLLINSLGLEDPLWPDAMQKHIGSIALPAALQSHNDRPQRSPTRLMGSPYPFRLVTILKGSVSSLSTAIITVLPNEK
ncbi:sterol regulatory element binding protein sre1 protein [Penicillium subrubescens]|uniref:sterol regulatory element binding protein sre1 protein n=1 Tax=Penicillium subrubescens TaxID=1316194 RepID=UPI002544F349|nr:sterol regulatory element binding protein sre1 protein [Penicillium subrubescens]KAJ5890699.1 sterol regulatory element binding protein sre1 protein [Penicillium subrubescens]